MATQLRGVMAALLTPFNSEQMLDKESLRRVSMGCTSAVQRERPLYRAFRNESR